MVALLLSENVVLHCSQTLGMLVTLKADYLRKDSHLSFDFDWDLPKLPLFFLRKSFFYKIEDYAHVISTGLLVSHMGRAKGS